MVYSVMMDYLYSYAENNPQALINLEDLVKLHCEVVYADNRGQLPTEREYLSDRMVMATVTAASVLNQNGDIEHVPEADAIDRLMALQGTLMNNAKDDMIEFIVV